MQNVFRFQARKKLRSKNRNSIRHRISVHRSLPGAAFLSALGLALVLNAANTFASTPPSQAKPSTSIFPGITYQGRLLNSDGITPMSETVDFVVGIYSFDGQCLLYEERQNNIDLSTSSGMFSLQVGSIVGDQTKRTTRDPGKSLSKIFTNGSPLLTASTTCAAGYTPPAGEARRLRMMLYSHTSPESPGESFDDLTISPIPQAVVAESVQGLTPENLVQVAGTVSQNNLSTLTAGSSSDASSLHNHDTLYIKRGTNGTMALAQATGIPTVKQRGDTWYDTTDDTLKYYNGTSVVTLNHVTLTSSDITNALGFTPANSSSMTTALAAKEPWLNAGSSGQYYRGDKTWQTLDTDAVPEGTTRKYFSGAAAKAALTGTAPIDYNFTSGAIGIKGLAAMGSANQVMGVSGDASQMEYKTLQGTTKQINISHSANGITFSAPQNIDSTATPTFAGMTLTGALTLPGSPTQSLQACTKQYVDNATSSLDWSKITSGKPTTLSGYGITDAISNAGGTPSIQAGTDTAKPAAGTTGRVYIASDTFKIYRDNGTSWDILGSQGGSGGGTVTSVSGSSPISVINGGSTPLISITTANSTTTGALSSTDWNTFNSKQAALGYTPVNKAGDSMTGALTISPATDTIDQIIKGVASQASDLTQWKNSSGSTLAKIDTAGKLTTSGLAVTGGTPAAGKILTSDASGNATWQSPPASGGTVTSITAGTGLTGGTITSTGTFAVNVGTAASQIVQLDATAKLPTVDGSALTNLNASNIASGTINASRLPASSTTTTGALSSTDWNTFNNKESALTFSAPFSRSSNTVSIPVASSSANGYLSSADWLTFNNKLTSSLTSGQIFVGNASNAPTGVAISGDATISNTGTLTLKNTGTSGTYNKVTTDAQGRITSGTMATLTASDFAPMSGDTGTGGSQGTVPAPAAGNAAAGKFLKADGTWSTPPSSSFAVTALTDAATITVDGSKGPIFTVTLGGNRTIANPTNLVNGQTYTFRLLQDATGGRTVTWDTNYQFINSTPFTQSTATNALTITRFISDGTYLYNIESYNPVICPTNYIPVPRLSPYTTNDFCVAKYEAKQSGSIAISQASGTPWALITQPSSITACQANGSKYDLITNAERQTIAQNIELVTTNWSSGTVGSGSINRGHSDSAPGSTLAASTDTDACSGTGQTCSNTVWDTQRRTHVLSNGQVIWDIAGNVWEWAKDTNTTNFGVDAYMSQVTTSSHTTTGTIGTITGAAKLLFGPYGNYTTLNSGEYGGLGRGWLNYSAGPVCRGGDWNSGVNTGVFSVILYYTTSYTNSAIGFRCVYHP